MTNKTTNGTKRTTTTTKRSCSSIYRPLSLSTIYNNIPSFFAYSFILPLLSPTTTTTTTRTGESSPSSIFIYLHAFPIYSSSSSSSSIPIPRLRLINRDKKPISITGPGGLYILHPPATLQLHRQTLVGFRHFCFSSSSFPLITYTKKKKKKKKLLGP